MDARWQIRLLGGLRAEQGERQVTRFRSRQTALLFAYLVYYPRRHPREVLIDLLWPEAEPEAGRHNLSQALSSLRRQLEPPGVRAGAVIVADRTAVALNPNACATDTAELEQTLAAADHARSDVERAAHLATAVEIYAGPLLPGFYEEWVLAEQARLAERFLGAVLELIQALEHAGEYGRALTYAWRAVVADPLRESAHQAVMRLLLATGQPDTARRHYREMERLLREELDEVPSAASRQLLRRIEAAWLGLAGKQQGENCRVAAPAPESPRDHSTAEVPPTPTVAPPPLCSASAPRSNLPLQLDRFFGREVEVSQLRELLAPPGSASGPGPASSSAGRRPRLITLTGPGGTGKTRLAIEAAGEVVEAYRGAVWFVPLADLADPGLIAGAILDALRSPRSAAAEPLEQAAAVLGRQPSLLVLDNMEHLVEGGAEQVQAVLQRVASLTCLVTSRQALRLRGERELPVPPLSTPGAPDSAERLARFASVRLLVDRAQAVKPDFQVTPGNAPAIAALCGRLEGIPLAIELAAARVQVLTPAQMAGQLGDRFSLLVTRRRGVPERHRTLRAAIDWSYRLLTPELQRFLARLSVFRGGWTVEAAEAVCDEPLALDYLAQLQEGSLILAEENGDALRFRMLEMIRAYAGEQVDAAERILLQGRHTRHYLALAEESSIPGFWREPPKSWLAAMDVEHDNLRAALAWQLSLGKSDEADLALRLAVGAHGFWRMAGHYEEARRWLEACAAQGELPEARADALYWAGYFAKARADVDCSRRLHEEGLALCRRLGDDRRTASALTELGSLCRVCGSYPEAVLYYEEALRLVRGIADRGGTAEVLVNLGNVAQQQGRYAEARPLLSEALALYREERYWRGVTWCLKHLAQVAQATGDSIAPLEYHREALVLAYEWGEGTQVSGQLDAVAGYLSWRGEYASAVSARATVHSLREATGGTRDLADELAARAELERARAALGEEDFRAAWDQGLVIRWNESVELVLGLLRRLGSTQETTAPVRSERGHS
jgi:predicted ATPase/DNA-binding SARP family transcriptional activator